MLKAFKIILLFILIAVVALVSLYMVHKDRLLEAARVRLESELSAMVRHPVNIGSVKYITFRSISMSHVTISSADDPGTAIADIDNVTVTVDTLSLIKDKRLETTVVIGGLHAKNVFCKATLRTESHAADAYKNIFDPSLVGSVSIAKTEITTNGIMLRDISGILKIDKMSVSNGKIGMTCNDTGYLLAFALLPGQSNTYEITARSDDLDLSSTFVKDNSSFNIEKLTGVFHTLRFDMKGAIKEPLSPEMTCHLKGTVETDLETLASIPIKMGSPLRLCSMAGSIRSDLDLNIKGYDLNQLDLDAVFGSDDLRIANVRASGIKGTLTISNGRLSVPLISGSLYNGTFDCDLIIDLEEKGLPYISSASIEDADFGLLMNDLTENKITVRGTLDADTSLRGYARMLSTAEGYGNITITDGDLGPMPILTPLLGNIYFVIQKIFPDMKKVTINYGHTDFVIENRKIRTDNLTLWGENISINAEGYMDFDGNLDFAVQNQFEHTDPGEGETWQAAMRNVIIQFGKVISKAHLRGTVRKPKWEFEYLNSMKNLIPKNIRNLLGAFR